MKTNQFKEKIQKGIPQFGTHVQMCVPENAEIMGLAGFDYIWVDTEHSPIDERNLLMCINMLKMNNVSSVVRVPVNDYNRTKKVLEMGPDGIVFPMINTKEQAENAVKMTLYPPYGTRGFGPMRVVEYGNQDVNEYVHEGVFQMVRLMQVETAEAVKNIDEILTVPYIDGFIFGPCDLSASVGELGMEKQEKTFALIKEAAEKIRKAGKAIGVSIGNASHEFLQFFMEQGATLISSGVDYGYLLDGAKQMKKHFENERQFFDNKENK